MHNLRRKENFTLNKHIVNTFDRWREAPQEYSHRLLTSDLFLSRPGKANIFVKSATPRPQLTELLAIFLHFSSFSSIIGSLSLTWEDSAL